jgi:glutamine synthetase
MNLAQRCGLAGPQREAQTQALLQRLRETGIEQLRVTWCDLHGQLRSKTLVCGNDGAAVADAMRSGVGMVSTVLLKDSSDRTAFKIFEPGALTAQPGLRLWCGQRVLLPDPASFVPLPGRPTPAGCVPSPSGKTAPPWRLARAGCCSAHWPTCVRRGSASCVGWKSSSTSTASPTMHLRQKPPPGPPNHRPCA